MIPNVPDKASLWLCLHFRQLPLEVFARGLDAGEWQRPLVVLERHRICRLNKAAQDIGIAPGNNMDTAYTLSEQVISFERDEEKEYSHLAHLAQWAYQFTPNVSIKAPDSLLLDITGCLKLFKGLASLTRQIEDGLRRLGYQPITGVSGTPLAALVLAKSRAQQDSENTIDSLERLPVIYLSIDEKIIDALHQMGIHDIGSLLALPTSGLSRRFGVFFVDYLARLVGDKPDPQKFISPEPIFFSEITFLSDVTDTQALVFPIRRLIGELGEFLTVRQLCANHLMLKLSHRSHPAKSFSVYLANPESDPVIFLPLVQLKLDQLDDIQEVDSISLAVNRFFPADLVSGDLFHGTRFRQKDGRINNKDNAANANRLLDMLHARLGPGTCYGLSVANDHRPERAWRPIHLGQPAQWQLADEVDENPRPVFLLHAPRPLNVAGGHPCLGGKLELLKGPERIDFGWWDESAISKPIARDYFVARQKSGALFWIFNCPGDNPNDKRWYLHGIFS